MRPFVDTHFFAAIRHQYMGVQYFTGNSGNSGKSGNSWEFVDTHYLARGQFMDTHCLAGGICKLMGVQNYEFPPYACRYWRCPSEGPRFPKIAQGFKA